MARDPRRVGNGIERQSARLARPSQQRSEGSSRCEFGRVPWRDVVAAHVSEPRAQRPVVEGGTPAANGPAVGCGAYRALTLVSAGPVTTLNDAWLRASALRSMTCTPSAV